MQSGLLVIGFLWPNLSRARPSFSAVKLKAWPCNLPDWIYPVVCNLSSGQLHFDNFDGRWGDQKHLDRFLQAYAVEKTKIEARKKGPPVTETPCPMDRSS